MPDFSWAEELCVKLEKATADYEAALKRTAAKGTPGTRGWRTGDDSLLADLRDRVTEAKKAYNQEIRRILE